MQNVHRIRVWDLSTRFFHWSLVLLVAAAIATGKIGGNLMPWHGRIGILIIGLLAFRLVWGVLGSTYARFVSFFPTPARLAAYLRGEWQQPGHNPLGALSVFALIGVAAFLAGSGLIANDDIAFRGPLYDLFTKDFSDRVTGLHKTATDLLIVLIALHVAAIVWYAHVRKKNLVKPMITGWQENGPGRSATGGGLLAVLVALVVAVAAIYVASGVWVPTPPPPPAPATLDW